MGHISAKLAGRFASSGKHRKPIREEAKRIRESARIPNDVKGIEQLVNEGLDPLHAAYAAAQHFTAFFSDSLSALDEMEPYCRIVGAAQDEYMPDFPPMSPVTTSYFTLWAFFDVRFGADLETIGTCLLDTGSNLGLNDGMLAVTRLFQNTRMGIYEQSGRDGDKILLRELLTDQMYICHPSAGYFGNEGELWYVRLCPPIFDLIDYHVAITTPYVLLNASKADWTAYLRKQLIAAGDQRKAFGEFMKYGPSLNHWNEFIFQGYLHHQPDAIFLTGLPDVKGSLPHASESREP
jgi:hypothetical protein